MMPDELQSSLQRLLTKNCSNDDLEIIATAVQNGQLILASGDGAVTVDGDIENSQIVLGSSNNSINNNKIFISVADAESIQTILHQRLPMPWDALTQKVRARASEKIINLFETIQLLNKRQVDVDRLYVDVYVLKAQDHRVNISGLLKRGLSRDQFDRLGLGPRGMRLQGLAVTESEDYPRLMVLGKPGSGKSTFLRHLAVGCAKGELLDKYIPYLLELRDVDENNFSIFQYIHEEFELESEGDTKQLLEEGKVLILLDGLDEASISLQQSIQSELRKFSRLYEKNRFVLTCRMQTTDYVPDNFIPIEVADFNPEQVERFALNWFTVSSELPEQGEALKENFMEQLREHSQTSELAVTPVLLSLACWIFEDLECFPEKRSELYREGLDLMLRTWDETRGISREVKSEIYCQLTLEERKQLLSYLAVQKFEQPENFVLFEESEIKGYIAEYLNISFEESRKVLRAISQQHGLIIKRAHEIWTFSHLTFQEYFVARSFLCENNYEDLLMKATIPHWREVFLLLAESLSSKDLILKMEEQARTYIGSSIRLQRLINWIELATDQFQEAYTFPGRRAAAMYFILDLVTVLYQDETFSIRDFDRLINLAADLARKLEEKFEQDDMWEVVLTLANSLDPPMVKRTFSMLGGVHEIQAMLERVVVVDRQKTGDWVLNASYSQALNRTLVRLQGMTPKSGLTIEQCLVFADFCRQALITSFQIDEKWIIGLSDNEFKSLENYLSVNILISDFLSISEQYFPSISQDVKARMLQLGN